MKIQEFEQIHELLPEQKEIFKNTSCILSMGLRIWISWIKAHLEPSLFLLLDICLNLRRSRLMQQERHFFSLCSKIYEISVQRAVLIIIK